MAPKTPQRVAPKLFKFQRGVVVKPIGARILVQPVPEDEFVGKERVLVKPQIARNKPLAGTVVAIGNGHEWDNEFTGTWPPVEVGQLVLYGRYAGVELVMEDTPEELWPRILNVNEVLGTVEGTS